MLHLRTSKGPYNSALHKFIRTRSSCSNDTEYLGADQFDPRAALHMQWCGAVAALR